MGRYETSEDLLCRILTCVGLKKTTNMKVLKSALAKQPADLRIVGFRDFLGKGTKVIFPQGDLWQSWWCCWMPFWHCYIQQCCWGYYWAPCSPRSLFSYISITHGGLGPNPTVFLTSQCNCTTAAHASSFHYISCDKLLLKYDGWQHLQTAKGVWNLPYKRRKKKHCT